MKTKIGLSSNIKIGIIGLGYVGYSLFEQFSKRYTCYGYDINESKVSELVQQNNISKCSSKVALSTNLQNLNGYNFFHYYPAIRLYDWIEFMVIDKNEEDYIMLLQLR